MMIEDSLMMLRGGAPGLLESSQMTTTTPIVQDIESRANQPNIDNFS